MAKPTTNNKKTVSKKQNKSLFGKKFDLKSRKVQFFTSILIIAILGGGYFTFRSFAATGIILYDGGATKFMQFINVNGRSGCSSRYIYPESKNNAPLPATSLNFSCIGPSGGNMDFSTYSASGPNGDYQFGPGTYRACMEASASGSPSVKLGVFGIPADAPTLDFTGPSPKTLCSAPWVNKVPNMELGATGVVNFSRGGSLSIYKIYLDVVSYGQATQTTSKN